VPAGASLSAAELLAARLRSALASNAMGGRAHESVKWRSALDSMHEAQEAWRKLAPVTDPDAQALEARFGAACRRVADAARQHGVDGRRPSRPAGRPDGHDGRRPRHDGPRRTGSGARPQKTAPAGSSSNEPVAV
jgi:hypothetical protein